MISGVPVSPTEGLVLGLAVVTTLAGALSGWLAFSQRRAAGGLPLAGLCATTVAWILAYSAELLTPTIAQKLVWVDVAWVPAALSPVFWVLFALEYTGRDRHVTREVVALLLVIPVLSTALLWTNDAHGLLLVDYSLDTYGSLTVFDWQYGPAFWVVIAYSYLVVLAGAFLVGETAVDSLDVYRFQSTALISAAVIPILASIGTVAFDAIPIDGTPYAFAASDVLCVVALTQFGLLQTRPVPGHLARGSVVQSLADAVVVVDVRGYVTDANTAAHRVLDAEPGSLVGTPLTDVDPTLARIDRHGDQLQDAEFTVDGELRFFDVQSTTLKDATGREAGRIVALRDVTDRRIRLQQLSVLNRVLRHDLRTRSNLILGYGDLTRDAIQADDATAAADHLSAVRKHAQRLVDVAEKVRTAESFLTPNTYRAPRSIRSITQTTVDDLRSDHPETEFQVTHGTDANVPGLASIVVSNLVENAAVHNDAATPRVTIETSYEEATDHVIVTIADNGPGIPTDELAVLEEGETPLRHGSGVGLWLVTWGTDIIGGTVSFETIGGGAYSDPSPSIVGDGGDVGTVVRLEVPALPASNLEE